MNFLVTLNRRDKQITAPHGGDMTGDAVINTQGG